MLKRIKFGAVVCLSLLVVASCATIVVRAADWPMYRGPDHTGISSETGWFDASAGVKVLWTQKIGKGFSSIAVGDGRAFTMGNDGKKDTVFCFDAKTGNEIWKFSYAAKLDPKLHEGGPSSTPTVDGKHLYALSKHGDLYCLTADKGKPVWKREIKSKRPGWGFSGSPLVVGSSLILNVGSAGMAIDKQTGKMMWSSGPGQCGYATPVPVQRDGKPHAIIFTQKSVVIVSVATGKRAWEAPWKTQYDINAADPIVVGENLFISSGYNTGCCLLPMGQANPKPIWRNKNMKNKMSGCVMLDGFAYGFDETTLTCLDLKTGEKKWTDKSLGRGTVMLADGKLILLSERGKLAIANASPDGLKVLSSGVILKAGKRCWTMPVLSNGLIYARNAVGDLACAKVGK